MCWRLQYSKLGVGTATRTFVHDFTGDAGRSHMILDSQTVVMNFRAAAILLHWGQQSLPTRTLWLLVFRVSACRQSVSTDYTRQPQPGECHRSQLFAVSGLHTLVIASSVCPSNFSTILHLEVNSSSSSTKAQVNLPTSVFLVSAI